MFLKKLLLNSLKVFPVLFLFSPCFGQLAVFCTYQGVEIPCRLIFENTTIEKGQYDLDVMRPRTTPMYYLRIKKGRKVLCQILGDRYDYPQMTYYERTTSSAIPDQCTLQMNKDPKENAFYFTVHSGRKNRLFPFLLLKFKVKYEE